MEESKISVKILDPSLTLQKNPKHPQHGKLVEEIEGLIKIYEDGHVERTQIVPCVSTSLTKELNLKSIDIILEKSTNIWARFYVPKCQKTLPLLVYFHGGGFCVGSAAWICYHDFLAKLAATSACAIMSVNYRLAPEHPLPAAYDDGLMALMWLKTLALNGYKTIWWSNNINFSSIFLGGDSAGANIAHHLSIKLCSNKDIDITPLHIEGSILIQSFFGGEIRTFSEKYVVSPPRSVLSLASADTYWRLSLPAGADRDHPWCNPLKKKLHKLEKVGIFSTMVCVAELDLLKDRNLEFCDDLEKTNNKVKCVIYKGVGHAFQILDNSHHSQTQTSDMILLRMKMKISLILSVAFETLSLSLSLSDQMAPKPDSAEGIVLNFVNEQNRPLNSQNVADNLQKFNLKKTAIQKALDTLADSRRITFKEYGKQKIYVARQDQFDIPNSEELNQMKEDNTKLQTLLGEEKKAISEVEGEIKSLQSNLTMEQLCAKKANLLKEIAELEKKLTKLRGGVALVSPEERKIVEALYLDTVSQWRRRKRMFKDVWDTITESSTKDVKEFKEELGIEYDEDVGVSLQSFPDLAQTGKKRARGQ